MTDIRKFEQFGLNTFYNAIPTLDNANDWFKWNQKLTHNAAQRINASEIHRVQQLLRRVKDSFKPEGSGTYVNLQRRYISLTRDQCGSAQALGAEIRRIHAEKLLLDPDCVSSEIK
ncbi:hypothetical protein K458DRAFT_260694, partial [Lentithecium fluviatile CBS 122367]